MLSTNKLMVLRSALAVITLSNFISANGLAQTACTSINNTDASRIMNATLNSLRPQISLNQTSPARKAQNAKDIYISGENYAMLNGERIALLDFPPYERVRRKHYVENFSTSSFRVLPAPNRVRLRINFETDGAEIKGWCSGCAIGSRDDRAADANIIPMKGESAPFVEMLIDLQIVSGRVDRFALTNVTTSMKVDASGFLNFFENNISRQIRKKSEDAVSEAWLRFSPLLVARFAEELGRRRITDINIGESQTRICFAS